MIVLLAAVPVTAALSEAAPVSADRVTVLTNKKPMESSAEKRRPFRVINALQLLSTAEEAYWAPQTEPDYIEKRNGRTELTYASR